MIGEKTKKMKKYVFVVALAVWGLFGLSAFGQDVQPAQWKFKVRELPGGEMELQFHLKLEPGWEIISQHSSPDGPTPMEISFNADSRYSLVGSVVEPTSISRYDKIFQCQVNSFEGEVTFVQKIRCNSDKEFIVRGGVFYQLCNDGISKAPENKTFSFYIPAAGKRAIAATPNGGSSIIANTMKSDADINIPVGGVTNEGSYVFIIANENYPNREVPYALNDGRVFAEYCNKTLGIPLNRIKIYENASMGQILSCVASIRRASEANGGDLNVIFYYAGHAFPDESTKDAYLMPVDGDSKLVETCYSLKRLYKSLGECGAKSVICFLDACFSGATREDDMLIEGRGVAIKPKEETPQGNLVVFTSASGAETAHQYEEKGHGLFTYFLLKKLQQSKGTTTLGDLYDYLSANVKRTSYDVNGKIQTPSVISSDSMEQNWRNLKL